MRLREVPPESCTRVWIDIKAEDDLHPGRPQAGACSTATGIEVKDLYLHGSIVASDTSTSG
jgi:hypothetical protein